MRRKVGVALVVAAYALVLYTSLAAPAYARAHPHIDKAMLAEYAGPWPVALASALAVVGIMLTLIPIRRGERWALWTSLAALIVLLATRIFIKLHSTRKTLSGLSQIVRSAERRRARNPFNRGNSISRPCD